MREYNRRIINLSDEEFDEEFIESFSESTREFIKKLNELPYGRCTFEYVKNNEFSCQGCYVLIEPEGTPISKIKM